MNHRSLISAAALFIVLPFSATARIGHWVEPITVTDYLDFVQCGFLLPVTIPRRRNKNSQGRICYAAAFPKACVNSVSPTTSAS